MHAYTSTSWSSDSKKKNLIGAVNVLYFEIDSAIGAPRVLFQSYLDVQARFFAVIVATRKDVRFGSLTQADMTSEFRGLTSGLLLLASAFTRGGLSRHHQSR